MLCDAVRKQRLSDSSNNVDASLMSKKPPTDNTAKPVTGELQDASSTTTPLVTTPSTTLDGVSHKVVQPGPRHLIWVGLAVAAVIAGWLIYAQPWVASVSERLVESVTPGPLSRVLAVNGRIAAIHSVAVRSPVAGTLTDSIAEEGEQVERGAILARLDDTPQQAVVRQAVAALDHGIVAQQQAQAALTRATALGVNVARSTQEDAQRSLELAQRETGRLQALYDQAQYQLTRYKITAPITGNILTRSVEPGQVIDLSTPLFTVADLSDLIVETDVDEVYATQIRPGMPALLRLAGETGNLEGTVYFAAPLVDAATGGLDVKIRFTEPRQVPVGLTVTANIIIDQQNAAISAPRSAIISNTAGSTVFLLDNGLARQTPVTVLDWPAERLLVTEGLIAGNQLIMDASGLSDGQRVKAVTP